MNRERTDVFDAISMSDSRYFLGDLDPDEELIVGPFRLLERIGTGAMGEVWRGRHHEQQTEVAVKVIRTDEANSDGFRRAFRHEVRSMAAMDHPFIARVLDYGEMDEAAEDQSLGHLQKGSPYCVMELARFGSLGRLKGQALPWECVKVLLVGLLDGLAHSHAQGLIHRDIKPENVLLTHAVRSLPGIRLSDFGLAYALWRSQEVSGWQKTAGTVSYMSPEQLMGHWRAYGPETDLYGLGCLGFELLNGEAPFRGTNLVQIAQAHLDQPLPKLERDDVPGEVEEWLGRLLSKDPEERYRTAAMAAKALRDLTGWREEEISQAWLVIEEMARGEEEDGEATKTLIPLVPVDVLRPHFETGEPAMETVERALAVPARWDRGLVVRPAPRLVGAGMGLVGVRKIPLQGREAERRKLWESLREVSEGRGVRACLIQGGAGVGKDRLAEWLCDRVLELGLGSVVRVSYGETREIEDAFAQGLARHFRVMGMSHGEVEEYFRKKLKKWGATWRLEWEALAEILRPLPMDHPGPRVKFAGPEQRYRALLNLFRRMTGEGPVVLWLNDVHRGAPAVEFVRLLLEEEPDLKVLVVMTARDDLVMGGGETVEEALVEVRARGRLEGVDLQPLDGIAMRAVLEEALFLEPTLAFELIQRSWGNPLHALELVKKWAEAGELVATPRGFTGRDGKTPEVPQSVTELWDGVVERLLAGREGQRPLLEAGVLLGGGLARETWEALEEEMGERLSRELVDQLLERKYIYETPEGLRFANTPMRESLIESARRSGRARWLARMCGEVLERGGGVAEEIGLLWLEADEPGRGADHLLRACEERKERGEYQALLYVASRGVRAVEGREEERSLLMKLRWWKGHGFALLGEYEASLAELEESLRIAEELGDREWEGRAAVVSAHELVRTMEDDEAVARYLQAWEALKSVEGPEVWEMMLQCCAALSVFLRRRGRHDEARRWGRRGLALMEEEEFEESVGALKFRYAVLAGQVQEGRVTEEEIEALIDACERHRTPIGLAKSLNLRAEWLRSEGLWEEALRDYQRSEEIYRLIDPGRGLVPRINQALVMIEVGNLGEGRRMGERLLEEIRIRHHRYYQMFAKGAQLPDVVSRGEWGVAEELVDWLEAYCEKTGNVEPDLELCLVAALRELDDGEAPGLRGRLQVLMEAPEAV